MDNGTPPAAVTGTYADGGVVSFEGVQFTLSGQPAVGDTYSVQPAGTESLFKTVNDLVTALSAGGNTPQSRAQLNTALNKALGQLDQGLDHVVDVRTQIGARLSALDTASSARDDVSLDLATRKSSLKDVGLRLGHQHAEPADGRPAGRAAGVYAHRADVAVRLPALMLAPRCPSVAERQPRQVAYLIGS